MCQDANKMSNRNLHEDRGGNPGEARSKIEGHVALVFVQLCFGFLPLFGKWIDGEADFTPRIVTAWRIGGGAVIFLALAFACHGKKMRVNLRDIPALLVLALLGVGANQWLFLEGLIRSTSVNAGLMMPLIAVFTFLLAALVRQERFSLLPCLGIVIAFAGTAQLALQKEVDMSRPYLIGNLLMVANTLCYSAFLVGSLSLARRYPPLVLMAWMYVLSLWALPILGQGDDFFPSGASMKSWGTLALIIAFPTVLGYLLNIYALARLPASTTAVYVFLQPLIAGIAGTVILSEALHGSTFVAGALILIGVGIVLSRQRR